MDNARIAELSAIIVAGHVMRSPVPSAEIPSLIANLHATISGLSFGQAAGIVATPPGMSTSSVSTCAPVHGGDVHVVAAGDVHDTDHVRDVDATARPSASPAAAVPLNPVEDAPSRAAVPLSAEDDAESGYVREGRRTLFEDHLVCLEDGQDVVLLSRHLGRLGIKPDEYRGKWSLPSAYPMVSPRYSRGKRELAARINFGKPRAQPVPAEALPEASSAGSPVPKAKTLAKAPGRTMPKAVANGHDGQPFPRRAGRLSPSYA